MKKGLFILLAAFTVLTSTFAQDLKPWRIEATIEDGDTLALEYAIPLQAQVTIGPYAGLTIPLSSDPSTWVTTGVKVYPFNRLGTGLFVDVFGSYYFSKSHPATPPHVKLEAGYRFIVFKHLTGFLESGISWNVGEIENKLWFNMVFGLGVAF